MMKYFLLVILSSLLLGCSATESIDSQLKVYSGGSRMGDATSFFWYTEKSVALPYQGSDYVVSTSDGWYQTHYTWIDSSVREIVREGEMMVDDELVPFTLHLRFNAEGEAIYQQYRVDGKIRPLQDNALSGYLKQAEAIAATTKSQSQKNMALIQGVWDGKTFETCDGDEYSKLEFNKTLPSFVIDRLSNFDNYLAFLGNIRHGEVYIQELLTLDDEKHDCIKPFKG
jgi:hypothetical protein